MGLADSLLVLAEADNSARNILVGIGVLIFLAIIIVPRIDRWKDRDG